MSSFPTCQVASKGPTCWIWIVLVVLSPHALLTAAATPTPTQAMSTPNHIKLTSASTATSIHHNCQLLQGLRLHQATLQPALDYQSVSTLSNQIIKCKCPEHSRTSSKLYSLWVSLSLSLARSHLLQIGIHALVLVFLSLLFLTCNSFSCFHGTWRCYHARSIRINNRMTLTAKAPSKGH